MKSTAEYTDITEQVGTFEGTPIYRTCTAEEQKDAVESDIPLQDYLDWYFSPAQDWQQDC